MDAAELESLRRRVYGPAATEEDRRRYREAVDAVEPAADGAPDAEAAPGAPAPSGRAPHRGALLAVLAVVAVAALALGLLSRPTATSAAHRASPSPTLQPPVVADLRPVSLARGDAALLATAFRVPGSATARTAALRLLDGADATARPAGTTVITTSEGSSDDGLPVGLSLPSVPLRRGDVLLLTIVAFQADGFAWRVLGERPGEAAIGHDVVFAQHDPNGARVVTAAARLPETTVVDGFTVASDPGTPLFYRFTVLRPDGGVRGTSRPTPS